ADQQRERTRLRQRGPCEGDVGHVGFSPLVHSRARTVAAPRDFAMPIRCSYPHVHDGLDYMTETLSADPSGIARAAALLRAGELVAFATETVYGLGADASNDAAVAAIFIAKAR